MIENSRSDSYAKAGVDITAGYKAVELMKEHIARTIINKTNTIGDFGGLFKLDLTGYEHPILVSGTDGVGTKLKLAFLMDKHDTIGIDCVAMCVNDVICCGAKPLFFLDYIACGKNYPEKIAQIVKGVCDGCVDAGSEVVGGETAEMPGFYPIDEYDLAGFSVGIVEETRMIRKEYIKEGNVIISLPSSGVHSNGFSLVRKVFNINEDSIAQRFPEIDNKTLGEVLLTPTKIYVKPVLKLLEKVRVNGISHITGGGFYENIPRCLPDGYTADINMNDVKVLPIFKLIQKAGDISTHDMFNTFNMGVGMIVVVNKEDADEALAILSENGISPYILGKITKDTRKVILHE